MTRAEIIAMIRAKAAAAGVDPNHVLAIANVESGIDPTRVNGTHKGLFQFGTDEWKRHGGRGDIFDAEAQMRAFLSYHPEIKASLTQTLGREPTDREMYLGWQQGAGGAGKLLTNHPTMLASAAVGNSAVAGNSGRPDQRGADFVKQQTDLYDRNLAQVTNMGDIYGGGGGLLGMNNWADLAGYNNPGGTAIQPTGFSSVEEAARAKAEAEALAKASAETTKAGTGLLAASTPKQQDFAAGAPQAHMPDAKNIPLPNYVQPQQMAMPAAMAMGQPAAPRPDFMEYLMKQRLQRRL